MEKKFRPILLAGGSGKRLWPLSTKEKPKQFIELFGDLSLFDLTLQRINNKKLFLEPLIVTSKNYLPLVENSLAKTGVEVEKIYLEPESKNTFAALALPVLSDLERNKKELYMAMPSDHYIPFNKLFYETCAVIKDHFPKNALTLMGVKPDKASTEYGYISYKPSYSGLKRVNSFIEKPHTEKANQLLRQPYTLWNSGIFCFEGSWFTTEIKKKNTKIYKQMIDLVKVSNLNETYFYADAAKFSKLEDLSFDHGFVELNDRNYVALLDAGWTDLGSWHSLSNLQKKPEHGLTLYSEGEYPRTDKPWGFFEVLLETEKSKVKILSINPQQKLSMQMHEHRSETWYITQGVATVTKSDSVHELYPGESIVIDKKEKHRIENFHDEILEIIEIQTGSYFGEDDIVRFEDIYGRKDLH